MCKVYISGALTNIPNPDDTKRFYESVGNLCSELGLSPYVPHLHTDPVKHPDRTPRDIFTTDKSGIQASDLVIAYIGVPSLGVGMELAYAEAAGIPIILMYEESNHVSRFPRGIPTVKAEIKFAHHEQALEQLRGILRSTTAELPA